VSAARKTLEYLSALNGLPAKERIACLLQIAGTFADGKDMTVVRKKIAEVESGAGSRSTAERLEALYKAASFFMQAREYETVRCFLDYAGSLGEVPINSYDCRFVSPAPVGVGGWVNSDFIKDPSNRDGRFHAYDKKDADLLITDVAVDRGQQAGHGDKTGDTFFSMLYDVKGWHIYIQSDEPAIERIMSEFGKGESSLEMYFGPGLEHDYYYQIFTRLAADEVSIFDWNTPNRYFRLLENKPGNLRMETTVLAGGWGTYVFIPWELFYDKLPFGNDNAWRFSVIRWSPSESITWGGRVHETGRWGHIRFRQPSEEQRRQILLNIVRRAWWKYTSSRDTLTDFWNGSRGDAGFYRSALEPLILSENGYAERLKTLDNWDLKTLEDIYKDKVPVWMEFGYRVEELRSDYLLHKLKSNVKEGGIAGR